MRMTDLVIGEHYAWKEKRAKLLATGAVLENYQHRGVQIEIQGHSALFFRTVPAREITSTWEDFQKARAKWDRDEQIATDQLRQMECVAQGLREAMERLGLCNPRNTTLNAYPTYIMLTFDNVVAAEDLTIALKAVPSYKLGK